ncbi:MAG: PP2C family protein-serine/threonine phosphatase [Lachnospiraceae bacterium]
MESQYWNDEVQQSAWLLDYDRRCMLDCADTFQNLAAVMGEMNWELEQEKTPDDREELLRRRQAMESRKQYAAHMRQMAGMLQSVADTSVQLIRLGGRQEKQIVRALAGEGIVVEDIYLLRGKEDRLQITISVRLTKNKSMTVEEIAGYLSVLMDIRLVPQKRNPYFVGEESVSLYFEEEPIFSCLTAAACATEETESVSGDSYSFLETDDSVAMILSDGVGSGESAARDSGRIVDLTERILDAGLGPDMAMLFLNGMAGAEGDENRMATLDLCRIDLYRGECETVKAGGAAGFIKRSDRVEKIQSRQLPLGMSASEDISEKKWQLNSGDLVILVSDGVVQNWPCGDGEYLLEQKIASLNVSSPVDLANLILRYAIRQCGGKIRMI